MLSGLKARTVGVFVGAALLVAGLVVGWRWALRPDPAVEYPADPADQPPAFAAFDTSGLAVPGCPVKLPDEAPAVPGRSGDEKLVEWGAVRFVRCTYPSSTAGELERIDVIDDLAEVTDAVRVLRRMLTPAQFDAYFGPHDTTVRPAAAFPSYRYLFQFPDGHVTEVDYRYGYHRDDMVRLRWSVRGSSVKPLDVPGGRSCGGQESVPCRTDGTMATVPD
jgi:hypothetical protein